MSKLELRLAWILALAVITACAPAGDGVETDDPVGEEVDLDFITDIAWSPDGDRLLVTWEQGRQPRLYGVLGPDTTGSAIEPGQGLRVSDGPDANATWSPDGLWVAFGSTRDGQGEIYRMRPDGMQVERLTNDPAEDSDPAYSPDGATIAFISTREDGAPRLHLMDADGGNVRMISNPPGEAHLAPVWAPDGSRIAVQVIREGTSEVYLAVPGGGWGRVKVGAAPSYHPNNDDIYVERNDSILVARLSSGSLRFVHENGRAPAISPDGRWLAFVRGAYPTSSVFVLDLVTREEYRLTR